MRPQPPRPISGGSRGRRTATLASPSPARSRSPCTARPGSSTSSCRRARPPTTSRGSTPRSAGSRSCRRCTRAAGRSLDPGEPLDGRRPDQRRGAGRRRVPVARRRAGRDRPSDRRRRWLTAAPGSFSVVWCAVAVAAAALSGWFAAHIDGPEHDATVLVLAGTALLGVLPLGAHAAQRAVAAPAFAAAAAFAVAWAPEPEKLPTIVGVSGLVAAVTAGVAGALDRRAEEVLRVWIVAGVALFVLTGAAALVGAAGPRSSGGCCWCWRCWPPGSCPVSPSTSRTSTSSTSSGSPSPPGPRGTGPTGDAAAPSYAPTTWPSWRAGRRHRDRRGRRDLGGRGPQRTDAAGDRHPAGRPGRCPGARRPGRRRPAADRPQLPPPRRPGDAARCRPHLLGGPAVRAARAAQRPADVHPGRLR